MNLHYQIIVSIVLKVYLDSNSNLLFILFSKEIKQIIIKLNILVGYIGSYEFKFFSTKQYCILK